MPFPETTMTDLPDLPWFPLTTARLRLRVPIESDFEAIQAYAEDPDVVQFMVWGPNTREDTARVLGAWIEAAKVWPRTGVSLIVERLSDAQVLGSVRLDYDPVHQQADFGYTLAREAWGQGYGTEAASALVQVAFETLKAHRVFADCNVLNHRSWRIMEKLGMRREATLIGNLKLRGVWRDTHVYGLLADEWRAQTGSGPAQDQG
jgi:hypothetical protein